MARPTLVHSAIRRAHTAASNTFSSTNATKPFSVRRGLALAATGTGVGLMAWTHDAEERKQQLGKRHAEAVPRGVPRSGVNGCPEEGVNGNWRCANCYNINC